MRNTALQQRPAPKLGLLINSIEVFNPEAKDRSEKLLRQCFDGWISSGKIHPESLIRGRIFGPHEAKSVADEFAAACVDLIVIANVAFPNGQVFLTFATHPHLSNIPLAVIAEPESDSNEWVTNAWCGVIMNNYVAKQVNKHIESIPGPFDSDDFNNEFERLLRVAGTIKFLRSDFVGRFGDAPGGFHSASGDQLAFAATFGTRVDTIDLSAVIHTYRTGKATGYLGESTFIDDEVKHIVEELSAGNVVTAEKEMVEQGVRYYCAMRAIIRANGYTSASVRCWPEFQSEIIPYSSCLSQGLLIARGDVASVACEADWPTGVALTIGAMLTQKPAACLDWVNYTGGSDIIQLGHCGVGIPGHMASSCCSGVCDEIALHPVARQAGVRLGPAHIGQYEYGTKTGICLTQSREGGFRLLAFTGDSSPQTAKGLLYSAADVKVENFRELNRLILDYGFPHHLAVALGDVKEDIRMLCAYLGVEFVSP